MCIRDSLIRAYAQSRALVPMIRSHLRADKAQWVAQISQEAAKAAEKSDARSLYKIARVLSARQATPPKQLRNEDGSVVATT
eukprot:907-Alexandrium_andersonii.AAC.1